MYYFLVKIVKSYRYGIFTSKKCFFFPYIIFLLTHCSKTGSVMPVCGEESMRSALMRAKIRIKNESHKFVPHNVV